MQWCRPGAVCGWDLNIYSASNKERLVCGTRFTTAIVLLSLVVVTTGNLLTPFFHLRGSDPTDVLRKAQNRKNV